MMDRILIYIIPILICFTTYGQNQFGIVKITDNIGRVDSVLFGESELEATVGIDANLGEINYYNIPYDSLEIRSIIRDTMCAFHILNLYLDYNQNLDLKIDYRPSVGATLPENSNFTFYVNAIEFPVTVQITQFKFNLNHTHFIQFDSSCQILSDETISYSQYSEIDTIFLIDKTSSPIFRIYPEVLWDNIHSRSNELQVEIYPNPVKDILTLKNNSNKNVQYDLINLLGKIIHKGQLRTNEIKKIEISTLNKGMYFLKLCDDKKISCRKIIMK